jgi:predicted Zn-dependent peptidase
MWQDIGLKEWLFDMDTKEDVDRIVPAVLDMVKNPAVSKEKVKKARKLVAQYQRDTMKILGESLKG